jgi:predicted nucleotidyltransferase
MLSAKEIESKLKQLKPQLENQFGVSRIGYFGSYAAELQTAESDLDVIVEFSKPVGWNFFTLQEFLEKKLDLRIDLVTNNSLKERIKDSILTKVRYI